LKFISYHGKQTSKDWVVGGFFIAASIIINNKAIFYFINTT